MKISYQNDRIPDKILAEVFSGITGKTAKKPDLNTVLKGIEREIKGEK